VSGDPRVEISADKQPLQSRGIPSTKATASKLGISRGRFAIALVYLSQRRLVNLRLIPRGSVFEQFFQQAVSKVRESRSRRITPRSTAAPLFITTHAPGIPRASCRSVIDGAVTLVIETYIIHRSGYRKKTRSDRRSRKHAVAVELIREPIR